MEIRNDLHLVDEPVLEQPRELHRGQEPLGQGEAVGAEEVDGVDV